MISAKQQTMKDNEMVFSQADVQSKFNDSMVGPQMDLDMSNISARTQNVNEDKQRYSSLKK